MNLYPNTHCGLVPRENRVTTTGELDYSNQVHYQHSHTLVLAYWYILVCNI